MVRDYSTGGGHLLGDTIIEGDKKIPTKKWQGYPPVNLNVIGKLNLPMPQVMVPKFTGKAEYTTRVHFPILCMLLFSGVHILAQGSKVSIPPKRRRCREWRTCSRSKIFRRE
jgi:hypothetical protein